MTVTLPPPLRVYDARAGENYPGPAAYMNALHFWLEAHGVIHTRVYRVEHYLIDAPFVRIHQYAVDDNGNLKLDAARRELISFTVDVLIGSPPPRPEDYA